VLCCTVLCSLSPVLCCAVLCCAVLCCAVLCWRRAVRNQIASNVSPFCVARYNYVCCCSLMIALITCTAAFAQARFATSLLLQSSDVHCAYVVLVLLEWHGRALSVVCVHSCWNCPRLACWQLLCCVLWCMLVLHVVVWRCVSPSVVSVHSFS
jgi:hypothetical protein